MGGKPRPRSTKPRAQKMLDLDDLSTQGKIVEPIEREKWKSELSKQGYIEFHEPISDRKPGERGRYRSWPKKAFTVGSQGPDFIAVNHSRKKIIVGDITAGPWSLADIKTGERRQLPNEFEPKAKQPHLQKTIEDAMQLARNLPPELDAYEIVAQDRYWHGDSSQKFSREITVYKNGKPANLTPTVKQFSGDTSKVNTDKPSQRQGVSKTADPRATVEKGKRNRRTSESGKSNPLTTSSNQPEYRVLEAGTAANDNDTPKIKIDDPKPKGVGKLAKVGKVAGWTLRLGASLFVGAIVEKTLSYVFRKIFNVKTFEEELQSKLNEINKNISTKIELEIEKNEEFIKNAYRTMPGIPIYLNIVWLYEFLDLSDYQSLQKVEIYLINISHVKLDNLGLKVIHSKEIKLGKFKNITLNYEDITKIKTITQSSLLVLPSDIFGTWIVGRSFNSVQQSPIGVLWIRLADNNNIEISGAGIAIRRGALGVNEYRQYNQRTKEYGIEGVLKFERWSIESRIIEPSLPNKPKKLVLEIKSQNSDQKLRLSVEIYNTDNKLSFTGNLSNQKVSGTMHRATSPFYEIQEYPENNQKNKLIINSVFDHFVGLQKIKKENLSTMVSPWDFDKFDIFEELPPKHLGVQLPDIHSDGFYLSQYGISKSQADYATIAALERYTGGKFRGTNKQNWVGEMLEIQGSNMGYNLHYTVWKNNFDNLVTQENIIIWAKESLSNLNFAFIEIKLNSNEFRASTQTNDKAARQFWIDFLIKNIDKWSTKPTVIYKLANGNDVKVDNFKTVLKYYLKNPPAILMGFGKRWTLGIQFKEIAKCVNPQKNSYFEQVSKMLFDDKLNLDQSNLNAYLQNALILIDNLKVSDMNIK